MWGGLKLPPKKAIRGPFEPSCTCSAARAGAGGSELRVPMGPHPRGRARGRHDFARGHVAARAYDFDSHAACAVVEHGAAARLCVDRPRRDVRPGADAPEHRLVALSERKERRPGAVFLVEGGAVVNKQSDAPAKELDEA